ncbi:MAG: hypothetical protein AMXMBFR64_24800 [Myxococcales bacterium]
MSPEVRGVRPSDVSSLLLDANPRLEELPWRDRAASAHRMDTLDATTGLRSRAGLLDDMERSLGQGSAAVVVVDLEDFRTVNALLGQRGGDRVLRDVALALGRRVRATDPVGRVGSDTFAVVLRGLTPLQVRGVAERLQRAVAEVPAPGAPPLRATVAVARAVPGEGAHSLLDRAVALVGVARRAALAA